MFYAGLFSIAAAGHHPSSPGMRQRSDWDVRLSRFAARRIPPAGRVKDISQIGVLTVVRVVAAVEG